MHLLNILTITSAGLMVGSELSVSAFVNPALRRLESGPQAQALSVLARSLGLAMPVWYGLCLALLALESFLHFDQTTLIPLLIATALWASTIVLSIGALVPIIAALVTPHNLSAQAIVISSMAMLAVSGSIGAYIGGGNKIRAAARVFIGGGLAMAITAVVGRIAGATL